ncbi:PAS domain-containing sensor histidine kinase [Cylindrospermum sp. FACHB-282]|uniref:PAS domain-containing sensor histidine kinase n=1 Tax=Cylindrospermum sp. FACHB-282 TaxID=2692794 RepID=UPI0035CD3240
MTLDKNTYESLQQELVELRQLVSSLGETKTSTTLKYDQEQMGLFIEYTPAAIAIFDCQMRYILASRRWKQDYGLGEEDFIGRSHYEVFPEISQYWRDIHQRCLAGAIEKSEEDTFSRRDGTTDSVKWEINPWYEKSGEIGGIIILTEVITPCKPAETAIKPLNDELEAKAYHLFDITEQQAALGQRQLPEAHLEEQEQFFRSIYDGFAQVIFVVDVLENGEFCYSGWNTSAEEATGVSKEEAIGKTPVDVQGSVGGASVIQRYKSCIEAGVSITYEECLPFRGQDTWWMTKINPLKNSAGQIYRLVGTTFNITERKQAEEALKQSQHFVQRIADSSPNILYIFDLQEQCNVYANHQLGTVLGYSDKEIQYMGPQILANITHPDDEEKILIHQQKFITAKDGEIFELEFRVRQANGEWCWFYSRETVFSRTDDGNIRQILGVSTDITDRKKAEIQLQQQAQNLERTLRELQQTQAQLIQSEKMSSVGSMVAGVAHEINNPVNFIHGNLVPASEYTRDLLRLVELYQKYYPNPPEEIKAEIAAIDLDFLKEDLIKLIQSMCVGTDRIRAIVLSLRNFSRLDEADFKRVDIHEGIDSTLMILQNRLKAKPNHPEISVIKEYGKLPPVDCYPGQLNQVFMNLISNAIEALEELCLEGKRQIYIQTEVFNDNWISIKISDNGVGISKEVISKLFDPFFTTKDVGKGTGLGLSISYQIVVDKHCGKLYCHSKPGEGAMFVIEIPITQSVVHK